MVAVMSKSAAVACLAFAACLLAGCFAHSLEEHSDAELWNRLNTQRNQYTEPYKGVAPARLSRMPSDVEADLDAGKIEQLDKSSGPEFFDDRKPNLGKDLLGNEKITAVQMTLRKAIDMAIANNLKLAAARLGPAISQTQIEQAEARFDFLYYLNYDRQKLDIPRPSSALATFGSQQTEVDTLTTGIRKTFMSGGELTLQTGSARQFSDPSFFTTAGGFAFYDSDLLIGLTQPLLRGFGRQVNRAEIVLARSARDQSAEDVRTNLLNTIAETETAYWNLVVARRRLLIRSEELKRTLKWRDIIKDRQKLDVRKTVLTEANAQIEFRRSLVIRARQSVRLTSDALKRLINDKSLLISDETLIVPADGPADQPMQYSMHDAVGTALEKRPEIRQALYRIRDASIRQRVADNLRLPTLNLGAAIVYNGIDPDNMGDAYAHLFDGDFIDYLVNVQFEYPIGNRQARELYRQRQLEHQQNVIVYRDTVQNAVLEVKDALRNLQTAYELIGAARTTRRAAADNLDEQKLLWDNPTGPPESAARANERELRLSNILNAVGRLADAQAQEIQTLVDYNSAATQLFRATGTLIERNGIQLEKTPIPGEPQP